MQLMAHGLRETSEVMPRSHVRMINSRKDSRVAYVVLHHVACELSNHSAVAVVSISNLYKNDFILHVPR